MQMQMTKSVALSININKITPTRKDVDEFMRNFEYTNNELDVA